MSKVIVGIYGIFDSENGECLYIGQSVRIPERWQDHIKNLKNGSHRREDFIEWFKDKGQKESALSFKILEETDESNDSLNRAEIKWFNKLKPRFYGKKPSMNEIWEHSEETKGKISTSVRKYIVSSGGTIRSDLPITCPTCKKEFIPPKANRTYCSVDCIDMTKTHDKANRTLGFTPRSDLDEEKIEKLYKDGYSLAELAKKTGVSHITIRNLLLDRDVKMRGHGVMPKSFTPLPPKKSVCDVCKKTFTLKKRTIPVRTCSFACRGILQSSNRLGVSIEEVLEMREKEKV